MGSLSLAWVVGFGGWLVLGDAVTAGTLVAFVLYVDRFFEPIREMGQRYNTFQATMAGCERIFNLLDTEPDLQDVPNARELPPIQGRVDFENVRFYYKDDEPVLRRATFMPTQGNELRSLVKPGQARARSSVLSLAFLMSPVVHSRSTDMTSAKFRRQGCALS